MANNSTRKSATQMFKKYPDVVSMKDVCEMLHISRNYAYKLIKTGELQRMDSCRIIRVTKKAVIDYAQKNQQNIESSPV